MKDIKLIVIGASYTGKTSLINKYTRNFFDENYKATIVSEFGSKIFRNDDGKLYRIQIWDMAGQDHFHAITKTFSKGSHGCITVCDATAPQTREE